MSFDIFISGGGVAGLATAAAFGTAGFRVLIVDPAPPVTQADDPAADLRTTAFLQPAQALLARAGLWDQLAPYGTPLEVMRLVDAAGDAGAVRTIKDFVASEISDGAFGQNLPNWLLRREMVARLDALETVTFRTGVGFARLVQRSTGALVWLTDGTKLQAQLVIAADGRASPVRTAAGINVTTTDFRQKALAFAVTHPQPHDNISTEVHRAGGPFTLVPLPDRDGSPASAVVWMEDWDEADRLLALPDADFNAVMTERSAGTLGPLTLASRRSAWPIIAQIADRFAAQRVALVAEAAHVVPPIGAQGLNMSLADTASLLDLAMAAPDALGGPEMLDAYHRSRWPEVRARVAGVTLLNRAAQTDQPALQRARLAGLEALHGIAPVRRRVMEFGLGMRRVTG